MVPRRPSAETRRRLRARAARALGAAALAGAAAAAASGTPQAASGAPIGELLIGPGDVVRIAGSPVGCRVVRRGVPPATMLDCRRAGVLKGTYGVLLGPVNVRVVRFTSASDATVVLTARHGGRAVCCTGEGRR